MIYCTSYCSLTIVFKFKISMLNRWFSSGKALCLKVNNNISNLNEIPNFGKIWKQYCLIKQREKDYKEANLYALLAECSLPKDKLDKLRDKETIVDLSFEELKRQYSTPSLDKLLNRLLSHLEYFPFDKSKLQEDDQDILTVGVIRDNIEEQYLAWKYEVDVEEIQTSLKRYKLCLYKCRSLRSLRKNISLLESIPDLQEKSVAEKIYLLNQKPFDINVITSFKNKVVGIEWLVFPQYCPKLLQFSHEYIEFVVKLLEDLEFSEVQIQESLPYLHISFPILVKRLDELLKNPLTAKYQFEKKFLHLLCLPVKKSFKLAGSPGADFSSLLDYVQTRDSKQLMRPLNTTLQSIAYLIKQYFKVEDVYLVNIRRQSNYKLVPESKILDTLKFLKENGFTDLEVAESITIIFYPRNSILSVMKIIKEASSLQEIGLENGCVFEETQLFRFGTKQRRKTLQLCLYYLEKPHNFNGQGVCAVEDISTNENLNFFQNEIYSKR